MNTSQLNRYYNRMNTKALLSLIAKGGMSKRKAHIAATIMERRATKD